MKIDTDVVSELNKHVITPVAFYSFPQLLDLMYRLDVAAPNKRYAKILTGPVGGEIEIDPYDLQEIMRLAPERLVALEGIASLGVNARVGWSKLQLEEIVEIYNQTNEVFPNENPFRPLLNRLKGYKLDVNVLEIVLDNHPEELGRFIEHVVDESMFDINWKDLDFRGNARIAGKLKDRIGTKNLFLGDLKTYRRKNRLVITKDEFLEQLADEHPSWIDFIFANNFDEDYYDIRWDRNEIAEYAKANIDDLSYYQFYLLTMLATLREGNEDRFKVHWDLQTTAREHFEKHYDKDHFDGAYDYARKHSH